MSERRKKDRYNETWTKDELTNSLKKTENKSSHKSEKSSRHKNDYDDEKTDIRKDRKHREEKDESHHKSRSDRTRDSSKKNHDLDDRERRHRSNREDKERTSERNHERTSSHNRHKKSSREDDKYYKTNGDEKEERHRRNKDERERHERPNKSHDHRDERPHDADDVERSKRRRERSDRKRDGSADERRRKNDDSDHYERKEKRERDSKDHRKRDDAEHERRREKKERDHKSREKEDDEERRIRKERRRKEKEDEHERQKRKTNENDKQNSSDRRSSKNREHSPRRHSTDPVNQKERRHHKDRKEAQSQDSIQKKSNSEDSKKDEEYNYEEEEFEDYADDFEDEEEVIVKKTSGPPDKMDELMRAIAAENERANSAQSSGRFRSTTTSERNDSPFSASSSTGDSNRIGSGTSNHKSDSTTMINFSAAKKSSASSKAKKIVIKRSKDLMNLIQLDAVSFDILNMAPVTEYNLYIKNYGNSNTKQASVQCNEDNLDQEVQTEIFDTEEKWSQHPPHEIKCCGGVKSNDTNELLHNDDRTRLLSTMRCDSKRLTNFLSRACRLVESVLIEDEMWEMTGIKNKQTSKLSFCEGYVSLQTNLAYLQGRNAIHVDCSPGSSHNLIAVAFEPASTSFSTRIDRKGLVAVWDARKPSVPEKILVCDACPTHCSFSSTKTFVLFVGTDDGSVLVYDLREPGIHHQSVSLEAKRETILRSPTYTTGYLTDGHSSPIVSIMSVGAESKYSESNRSETNDNGQRNHSGLAFQLASLEEAANLCIWIVVELLSDTVTDDDLGLAPHGRIKLIRSLNLKIRSPSKSLIPDLPFRTTCVQFSVIDPNNFYVGTDTGHIVHCTQYMANSEHQREGSKFILFNEIDAISPVTSIDINPFQLFGASMILAGYNDGSLRLYLSDRELPIISWPFSTEGAAVVKVQWSTSRPSVFFVLDSSHKLHIWDLAIMHASPIKTEESQSKLMCHFSLSNTSVESTTRNPEIVLTYDQSDDGSNSSLVEVHKLAPHFSQVTDNNELEQLTFLLQSLL